MKKVSIFTVLSILLCSVVYADQLQFVTLMSAPVGSFSKVETVTKAKAKNASIYGNTSIQLRGNGNAELGDVVLKENAALTGRVGELSANTLTIQSGGNITGKGLWANTVTMDSATDSNVKVKETLYVENGAEVSGAAVWGGLVGDGEYDFVIDGKNKMSLEEGRAPGNLRWLGDDDKTERLLTSSWGVSSSAQEEEPVTRHTCITSFEINKLYEDGPGARMCYESDLSTIAYGPWEDSSYDYETDGSYEWRKCGGQLVGITPITVVTEKNDKCSPGDKFLYHIVRYRACRYQPLHPGDRPRKAQLGWACAVCGEVTSLGDCASDITAEKIEAAFKP